MKKIELTKGKITLINDLDYEGLSRYKWCCFYNGYNYYAIRCFIIHGKKRMIMMHRFILGISDSRIQVDHRNRNSLDNRRNNLRLCTNQENSFNSPARSGTSRFKGVYFFKAKGKWISQIRFGSDALYLGSFRDETEAAKRYDKEAKKLFGEFAYLNFPNS